MKQSQTDRLFLGISMVGFLLMALSFLLMPIDTLRILPGLLFWGGLLTGTAFQICLEIRRRAFFRSYRVRRERMQKPRNGLLTFASNDAAVVADVSLLTVFVISVFVFLFTKGTGYLCYICISLVMIAFCAHCILNGRIYFHVNNQDKVRQVLERKKESTLGKGEGTK